ncbi:hypothetical protein [Pseudomonas kilonensis]|uniref:hypothetical protein n=1 Tax=Pseudomonas kilonensis TaxID=132476 RepID=UPI00118207D2|nr:hypothetical protein [Pseudomonas kilonensis]
MKIVMLENRYKTFFWDALAEYFIEQGHVVAWVVQNPSFMPKNGVANVIAFPSFKDVRGLSNSYDFEKIVKSDRYINYFGGDASHYEYYYAEIERILLKEKPELVIGEATLFHELMAVDWCKKNNVPFFHPSMPGYPGGRYSIYLGDTKDAIGGATDLPSDEECYSLAEAIRKRERIPEYMRPSLPTDHGRIFPVHGSFANRLLLIKSYLRGERFNTPSPWRKRKLDKAVSRRLIRWSEICAEQFKLDDGCRYLLYPMQMQPESNLDLWGQEYREQSRLISDLADILPPGWKLLVKLNPKSKYELDDALINMVSVHNRIIPIPFEMGMEKIFNRIHLVCTVTGTIAVESVLSCKPVVQFGPGVLSDEAGYLHASSVADVKDIIARIEAEQFQLADDQGRTGLVKKLYFTTFPGLISDPASLPSVLDSKNIIKVGANLIRVAERCI